MKGGSEGVYVTARTGVVAWGVCGGSDACERKGHGGPSKPAVQKGKGGARFGPCALLYPSRSGRLPLRSRSTASSPRHSPSTPAATPTPPRTPSANHWRPVYPPAAFFRSGSAGRHIFVTNARCCLTDPLLPDHGHKTCTVAARPRARDGLVLLVCKSRDRPESDCDNDARRAPGASRLELIPLRDCPAWPAPPPPCADNRRIIIIRVCAAPTTTRPTRLFHRDARPYQRRSPAAFVSSASRRMQAIPTPSSSCPTRLGARSQSPRTVTAGSSEARPAGPACRRIAAFSPLARGRGVQGKW
ncbi:hypothetical protein FA95DRAFT_298865 [Auriscalpium vulgare]|uniref:Uncharacterized protein n=1 Tax=Auriscalpium vulgare TaxID=40419 RepID=A0ACB8RJY6_9AGAM|nr:hypothetical protein FA95DRAFT_298865 [Auriscalpium vulgare]